MLFTTTLLFVAIVVLASVGYIISAVFDIKNSNLINVNKTISKFIGKESWISMVSPIYGLTLHFYNVFLWAIFSIHQVFKVVAVVFSLIVRVLKLVIEVLKWLWSELIDPTIFFVLKLFWHYGVKFIWKFFALAISFIAPSYSQRNLILTIKALLKLASIIALGYVLTSLFDWFAYIAVTASFIYLIYTLNVINLRLNVTEEGENVALRLTRKNLIWFGIAGAAIAMLHVLQSNSQNDFFSNLAFPGSEFLMPIGLIFLFASFFAGIFLIAFDHYEKEKSGVLSFIKSILRRIPKIIYSSPFAGIALIIVSIIPILLYFLINWGVNEYSSKDVVEHYVDVVEMIGIDNQYRELGEYIDTNDSLFIKLDSTFIADSTVIANQISSKEEEITNLKGTESLLLKETIFTHDGRVSVNDNQFFSFPPFPNSESITWMVIDSDNKIIRKVTKGSELESSNLFNHTWHSPGNYKVEAYLDNTCDTSSKFKTTIEVKDLATRIGTIEGPTQICSGDEISFSINQSNLDLYEWEIPNDAIILEGRETNKIRVKWGKSSGLVSIRGKEEDKEFSSRSYIEVYISPILGSSEPSKEIAIPEDLISSQLLDPPFVYYDIAVVKDAIYSVSHEIKELKAASVNLSLEHAVGVNNLESENSALSSQRRDLIVKWLSLILSLLGLVILITILLAPAVIYSSLFNFRLYNYEEEGAHYFSEKFSGYKNRNPQQPLFGWFMLGVALILTFLLTAGTFMGGSSSSMFQSENQSDINYSDVGAQGFEIIKDSTYVITGGNQLLLTYEKYLDLKEDTQDQEDHFDWLDQLTAFFQNDEDSEGIEELDGDLIDSLSYTGEISSQVYRIQLLNGDLNDCKREMRRVEASNYELDLECFSADSSRILLLLKKPCYSIDDACEMLKKTKESHPGAFIVSHDIESDKIVPTSLGESC
ncbi:hypothetical protein N8911_01605 [bacterium]|nr:hypothetical protein [bacterium]